MLKDITVLSAAVVIGLGLIEVIKILVGKAVNGKNGRPRGGLTAEEHGWLSESLRLARKLDDDHSVTDSEGVKMWYTPRRLVHLQEDILKELRDLNEQIRKRGFCPHSDEMNT